MELNEKFIKVGKIPVATSVPLDSHIQLQIIGEDNIYQLQCVKVEQKNNQDGTYDEVYVLKHT